MILIYSKHPLRILKVQHYQVPYLFDRIYHRRHSLQLEIIYPVRSQLELQLVKQANHQANSMYPLLLHRKNHGYPMTMFLFVCVVMKYDFQCLIVVIIVDVVVE